MAKFYAQDIPGVVFNESELLITYQNGSEIMVVGSDNPDSLRGIALWGAFLDEYPQQSPVVFTEIITKCLADHQGYCIFGGTPKGKGHFYTIYQVAQKDTDNWCLIYRTIDQSLKDEEGETIDNLRLSLEDDRDLVKQGIMTQDEFQQEWYNSFEAAIKGAVYLKELSKMRQDNRIKGRLYDDALPVYTLWDLGIRDAMAIGFYQRAGREIRMIDYYENTGLGMKHYIKVVKDKPYIFGRHFAPHDIKVRELSSGKTRLETARELGIVFDVIPQASLEDGIDAGRSIFSRLWVDKDTCEIWLDLIGQYHYAKDEKRGVYTRVPVHDYSSHAADVHRHLALVEDDLILDHEIPQVRAHTDPRGGSDEYVGQVDPNEEYGSDGKPRHPMFRGVDLGQMGHKKK